MTLNICLFDTSIEQYVRRRGGGSGEGRYHRQEGLLSQ